MFQVVCSLDVANLQPGGGGSRIRRVTVDGKEELMRFSRQPTLFKNLPPEVAADPHLLVEEVEDEKPSASTSAKTKKGRR